MALLTVTHYSDDAEALTNFYDPRVSSYGKAIQKYGQVLHFANDTGATIAADSIIDLGVVNRCVILPSSMVIFTAFGAGRTLDFGLQEFTKFDGTTYTADIDVILDGVDVQNAGAVILEEGTTGTNPTGLVVAGQTHILCKVLGDTMPDAATITLHLDLLPYRG